MGFTRQATESDIYSFYGIRSVPIVIFISESGVHLQPGKTKDEFRAEKSVI